MSIRLCVLPTQYDIIDFRQGNRPENILVRSFQTRPEVLAYEDGIAAIGDEYDRIDELGTNGGVVSYRRRSEDPEIEGTAQAVEASFKTPAEAQAYCKGLADAEGFAAPLIIDDTDEDFEQLIAWSAAEPASP
ncbi:MAG: hypothetical protein WAV95_17810 [Azonexus sp.]